METENGKSLVPHFAIGAIVIVVILVVIFWPSEPEPVISEVTPPAMVQAEPERQIEETPQIVTVDDEPVVQEDEPEPLPIPEPKPLDTSDGTVKTKLLQLSDYDSLARLIVDDALLKRFVVMTYTLADETIAANNRVLVQPDKPFRTFQQADKQWIDPASYKRYTPYVDALTSIDSTSLLELYAEYKPALDSIFAEISGPSENFNDKLAEAINVLLDTPEVPVPVEVYNDSVMLKFADPQLEALTAPQKQLLRTGPENMRRIKAKLREIKEAL
ncbi:MAG: DUF3014 domain-containing protein [Paraglaciecola sp.]|uniref:DUF3014 domain-containing protein n=1 Tax=Paraglaciecola sp. TaxID=1920173 RepID=UPI00273DD62D|nr:DUF3014 domain-containing protein [Paraglaciecola sp.]MDP5031144.1 DUF3014 domain-containing protein [Paraglaciecola sp.]MDP5132127.1 DUF3014 domain-containing protein [Paraglaciecola sp.]